MSKSKGGVLTVSVLEEQGYDPIAFRYMCLGSHYRKQLMFTYDNLKQAQNTLNKLRKRIASLKEDGEINKELFDSYVTKFKEQLENDLNTSNALTIIYEVLKDEKLNDSTKIKIIEDFDKVFSLDLIKEEESIDSDLEKEILEKIEERKEAKMNKDYVLADQIRNELSSRGVKLIDTKDGTTYEIIKD